MGEPNIITIIFPVYILSTVENSSTRKILDPSDFVSFGFNGVLAYWIFVYTNSMVKGGVFTDHTSTSFYAHTTRIWTPTPMGYIAYYARTYAASSIKYYGMT